MFLFSMGITRGKWGTLINTLCSFKHHYDANTPLAQVMPELVEEHPDTYANMGIHDLGDTMFAWLKENNPGARLNAAYSGLPVAEITPREAYNAIVSDNVEMVAIENLPGRIAANSVIPYPPGIPMLLSGKTLATPIARRLVIYVRCSPGTTTSLDLNMKPKERKLLTVCTTLCA